MILIFRRFSFTLGFVTIPLALGYLVKSEKSAATNYADYAVNGVDASGSQLPARSIIVKQQHFASAPQTEDVSSFLRAGGYADMTNTGTMYITSGTIVAAEGSAIISVGGNTDNNGNFYVKGDWTNDGTYGSDSGKVIFWDVDDQVINGTTSTDFYDMEVDKSPGKVTLNLNTEVSNVLTLTNGELDLNSNTLLINSEATSAITYSNGYVKSEKTDNSSKVTWSMGSTTGPHIIPFGTASGSIIPLTLNLTSGNIKDVTASTYPTPANNLPYPVTPDSVARLEDAFGNDNSANTVDRFWQIDRTGLSGILAITFTYANGEEPATGEAALQAQRYNVPIVGWDQPFPSQSANIGNNSVSAPGITTYGSFTLSKTSSPLPIELLTFTATPNEKKEVVLNWITSSEVNNAHFTIQRSKDITNIEEIEEIPGAGSTTETKYYSTIDKNPYEGDSYYRLKQTDYDGRFALYEWKHVNISNKIETEELTVNNVYPNPFTDEFKVEFSVVDAGEALIQLVNNTGQLVFTEKINITAGMNSYTYSNTTGLQAGAYFFNILYKNQLKSLKLIRKN